MSLSVTLPPRFSGLVYKTELTDARQLPKVSAYVADFAAFPADSPFPRQDGAIVFQSPSGKVHVLGDDSPDVGELTRKFREGNVFGPERLPWPNDVHRYVRNAWREVKALFVSDQLPRTNDLRGETYYETLFETPYILGTQPVECLLTDALGHNFEIDVPTRENRNRRHVQIMPTPVPEVAPPTDSTQ